MTLTAAQDPPLSAVIRCDLPEGHRGGHHAHLAWTETQADAS